MTQTGDVTRASAARWLKGAALGLSLMALAAGPALAARPTVKNHTRA